MAIQPPPPPLPTPATRQIFHPSAHNLDHTGFEVSPSEENAYNTLKQDLNTYIFQKYIYSREQAAAQHALVCSYAESLCCLLKL